MSSNSIAIKRINRDIREINRNPIEGIGITSLDNDPMKYLINMELISGPYRGYCVQLLLSFPNNYPLRPPILLIYPNQIDEEYHNNIFQDSTTDENGRHFRKMCFDLFDNNSLSTPDGRDGWNPSYSLTSLLLQIQNYISDPDIQGRAPNNNSIDYLMRSMDYYYRKFIVDGKVIVHTWKNPYPKMYYNREKYNRSKDIRKSDMEIEEEIRNQQIKEDLSCYILKVNYIDDNSITLGYPIIQKKGKNKNNKIELYPIPELVTYDGYINLLEISNTMVDYYFNNKYYASKSSNNDYFKNWIPIYINKDHYLKNKETILKAFTKITNDNYGNTSSYTPDKIFQVIPTIINSMIIGISNGNTTLSSSFIKCYFQFILLFKKLSQDYEGDYLYYLNSKLSEIKKNNYTVNKTIIPELGNFFVLLIFFSSISNSEEMRKIYNSLYEDSLTRQMYWIFHGEEHKNNTKKLLLKSKLNDICINKFEDDPSFNMDENALEKFNEDLRNERIFDEVVDIICNDPDFLKTIFIGKEKVRVQVVSTMKKSFKNLFIECSKEGRNSIREIVNRYLNFKNYFSQ